MAAATPARVIVDYEVAPHHQWCWRPEWYSGSDSVYCLLAKFSRLNVLTIRDLCELFVERNATDGVHWTNGRPHYPIVDLRFSRGMRVGRLANVLKLDAAKVQLGFAEAISPEAAPRAASYLKWCAGCAKTGFHSAFFQLDFVCACPLHDTLLLHRCPSCAKPVPYRLHAPSGGVLFCCPTCGRDLAPILQRPRTALTLKGRKAMVLAEHVSLIQFTAQLPTLIDACRSSVDNARMLLMLGKSDKGRRTALFRQFVADVLISVAARAGRLKQLQLQLLQPLSVYRDSRSDTENPSQSHRIPAQRGESVTQATDRRLTDAEAIYRSVRRHLWRHQVCGHRKCAQHAMKSLWWDLDGEQTASFCATALAFIRWRMQWEGRRVASRLTERPGTHDVAYGLLGWVCADAPIASSRWSAGFERWLNAHVLAAACFDSYRSWTEQAARDEAWRVMRWNSRLHNGFGRRHWACSGCGNESEPGLFSLNRSTRCRSQI
ncbi:hypothetical protein LP414_32315 [Polaromonas sp. P1(28)-13]|nr:hypothetical protein LP414_32315 [Polaromonas sp. P1(28)-13]